MKTALLAIIFLQGSATTSTDPIVFVEEEATAKEQNDLCS